MTTINPWGNKHSTNWDTSKCRRYSVNCKHYSDCQAKRLKMEGYGEWKEPKSTDECYESPEESKKNAYTCPLSTKYQVTIRR
jgi:hypothetical protein